MLTNKTRIANTIGVGNSSRAGCSTAAVGNTAAGSTGVAGSKSADLPRAGNTAAGSGSAVGSTGVAGSNPAVGSSGSSPADLPTHDRADKCGSTFPPSLAANSRCSAARWGSEDRSARYFPERSVGSPPGTESSGEPGPAGAGTSERRAERRVGHRLARRSKTTRHTTRSAYDTPLSRKRNKIDFHTILRQSLTDGKENSEKNVYSESSGGGILILRVLPRNSPSPSRIIRPESLVGSSGYFK